MLFMSNGIKTQPVKLSLAAIAVFLLWLGQKSRATVIQALIAFPIANAITDAFKNGAPRLRPCVDLGTDALVRGGFLDSPGTASAHSANMAAVAFVFAYRMGWWGIPWFIIAFLTGISRIYNGLHYPSQVLLGWACGCFAGFCIVKTWDTYLRLRRKSEQPIEES